MKQTFRLLLILTAVFVSTEYTFGQTKYPYTKYDKDSNCPVIVSRDDKGGVHPEALTGDMENRIEETLQVKNEDAKADAVSWINAQRACVDGWRLPTKRELQLIWLTGGAKSNSYAQIGVTPLGKSTLGNYIKDGFIELEPNEYWTLTSDGDDYWYVNFANGKANSGAGNKRVRCVKGHRQEAGTFAYSNIVMIGGKLTFAEKRIDDDAIDGLSNEDIPANSQGLQFKFGSLVGIGSTGNHDTEFDTSDVVFSPSGYTKPTVWTDIPYYKASKSPYLSVGDIQGGAIATDHIMEDFAPIGYDISQGLGDICRYISDQGWVKGRWRLPTATDIWELAKDTPSNTGVHYGVMSTSPAWEDITIEKNDGTHQIEQGWWFGSGATSEEDIAGNKTISPENARFFPAGGLRNYTSGTFAGPGRFGYHWSSTASTNDYGYRIYVHNIGADYPGNGTRAQSINVRCVAE